MGYGGGTSGSRIRDRVGRRWLSRSCLLSVVPTTSAAVLSIPVVVVGCVACVAQSVCVVSVRSVCVILVLASAVLCSSRRRLVPVVVGSAFFLW